MPTGYTAPIEDDPEYTLAEYAWDCAQNFCDIGYLESHEFRSEQLAKDLERYELELKMAGNLALPEAEVAAEKEYTERLAIYLKSLERHKIMTLRYTRMRARTEACSAPPVVKDFMLQQLEEGQKYSGPGNPPDIKTGAEYKKAKIRYLAQMIELYKKDLHTAMVNEELGRVFLAQLVETIGPRPKSVKLRGH